MLKISPKLIDVERNRIEYVDEKDIKTYVNNNNGSSRTLKEEGVKTGMFVTGGWKVRKQKRTETYGRFPTQMFYTGDKKELFKYVKNIS